MEYLTKIRNEVLIQLYHGHSLKTLRSVNESRHKKACILCFHVYEICRIIKSMGTKKRIGGCQGLGKGKEEWELAV